MRSFATHPLHRRDDDGFTLIELMVVLLIIAVLLAIAIPTFLGAKNTANARSAQSDLRNALTSEQTNWASNQVFATLLTNDEPAILWLSTSPTVPGQHGVYATLYTETVTAASGSTPASMTTTTGGSTDDGVVLVAYGKDNYCYAIYQSNNASLDFTAYEQYTPTTGACATPSPPTAAAANGTNAAGSVGSWAATF